MFPDWVPLLLVLTRECPSWLTWKNIDDAIEGRGDVDAVISQQDLPKAREKFARWVAERGGIQALRCTHFPGSELLYGVWPDGTLKELHLTQWTTYRLGTVIEPHRLGELAVLDPRGFRRIDSAAETLLLLLLNGCRRWGRPDIDGLSRKRIAERLNDEEPERVHAVAKVLFGVRGRVLRLLSSAVEEGGWHRPAALAFEASSLALGVRYPHRLVARARIQASGGCMCVLTQASHDGRRAPSDLEDWLRTAEADHEALGLNR